MTDPRLRATAFHEAGHAVMALSLGRIVLQVSIIPSKTKLGECQLQKGRSKPTKDALEDDILILYAGMAAEAMLTGEYHLPGAAQDLKFIRKLISQRAGGAKQIERLERRLLAKTENILSDSATWKAVEKIAEALLDEETISGRAARHWYDHCLADT